MEPYNNTVDLFQFFGFAMHPRVVQFLETHTTLNIGKLSGGVGVWCEQLDWRRKNIVSAHTTVISLLCSCSVNDTVALKTCK